MAPEIKEGKMYNGTQVDIFSFGVILFVVTHGIFPFKEARAQEYFFNLLMTGQHTLYFNKVNGNNLSSEFKDLMISLLQYDANKRPTVSQIKNHPWMQKSYNAENARRSLAGHISKTVSSNASSSVPNSARKGPQK